MFSFGQGSDSDLRALKETMIGLNISQVKHLRENAGGNIKVSLFQMTANTFALRGLIDIHLSVFRYVPGLLVDLNT
eukprot:2415626-Heterocapsa_arctica.AAC.1